MNVYLSFCLSIMFNLAGMVFEDFLEVVLICIIFADFFVFPFCFDFKCRLFGKHIEHHGTCNLHVLVGFLDNPSAFPISFLLL